MTIGRALIALALMLVCTARADAAGCTVAVSSVVFGHYDVFTPAPTDSTGAVVLNCNGGAKNVAITISRGSGTGFATRRMVKAGSEDLFYNVFLEPSRSTIWGDGSGGSQMHIERDPPNKQDTVLTIFGRIQADQDVSAGSYSDTLTVTVNY